VPLFPPFDEWLSNSRQCRICVSSILNIIEADHRNIFRNLYAGFLKREDGPDSRDIIVRDQRSKRMLAREQFLGVRVTKIRRRVRSLELNNQLGSHSDAQFRSYFTKRIPSIAGIRTQNRASHKSDSFMASSIRCCSAISAAWL